MAERGNNMILTWKDYAIVSVVIDGAPYSSETGTVTVDLQVGTHRADVHISHMTTDELRKKVRLNWLSFLGGSASYSLDDAYRDTFENVISFNFTLSGGDEIIDVDGLMSSLPESLITRTRQVSAKKMRIVNRNLCFPVALLGGILTSVFGVLGFVAIRNGNSFAGILASAVAVLNAVIVAWAIVGINIKMRRLCSDGKER